MAFDVVSLLIHIIVNIVLISPSLWLAGKALVGRRASFGDSVWIVALGTIAGVLVGVFFNGFITTIVMLILWLLLVKSFFNTGWAMALVISIIAVIIFVIISVILGLIGLALISYII